MNEPLSKTAARSALGRIRRRRGVTLLEVLTTSAVAALLVGGMASAVRLALNSQEGTTGPTANAIDTSDAIDRLNAELRLATTFTERTATAVTFTVADQNGDGLAETIRYAWAGAGSPLTRTFNGAPAGAAAILDNVQSFNMTFLTRTVPPPTQESAEQLLASYVPAATTTTTPIGKNIWGAQYFQPTLPTNTVSWKITRIRLLLKQGSITANVNFLVSNVDASQKPTGSALETYSVSSSTFPSGTADWVNIPYSTLSGLAPALGYSFQVETLPSSTSTVANLGFNNAVSPALTQSTNCYSTNQGAAWSSPLATKAIFFQVYGTVTTQGP